MAQDWLVGMPWVPVSTAPKYGPSYENAWKWYSIGGQANFGESPTFAPWMGQNVFNQSPFGMGLPGQQPIWLEMWKDKRFNLMDRNCSGGKNAHGRRAGMVATEGEQWQRLVTGGD
ncbi:hypothetical protein Fot_52355 [Forsythia ovata]|uniref:Uncharacterized protein n=1 Tax=Forsythia ovata TaxID=205694 RepID=A0ABD1PLA4_9LAMI